MPGCRACRVSWPALLVVLLVACAARANSQCQQGADLQTAAERFDTAQQLARIGDHDCAGQLYAGLMFDEPDNVDYMFGYAQVLHWSGQDAEALPFLVAARKLAPGYEDVWRLEAQVREAMDSDDADSADFAQAAALQFPDASWIPAEQRSGPGRHHWTVSGSRDYLSTDSPDWQQIGATLNWQLRPHFRAGLTASQSRRFDQQDQQWGAGVELDLTKHWSADAGFAASPSASHLAQREYSLDVSRRGANGWVAYLRIRDREYSEGTVHAAGLAIERYFRAYRVEYALGRSILGADSAVGHRVAIERYLNSGAAIGMIAAAGEEIEVIGPGQLLRSDTHSLVATFKHALAGSLTMGWALGVHEQGDLYRRIGLGVSLSGAF